jgi:hypothetical protein
MQVQATKIYVSLEDVEKRQHLTVDGHLALFHELLAALQQERNSCFPTTPVQTANGGSENGKLQDV